MVILSAHTKGGVGKTLLAVNLAGLFAAEGVDLLLLDADPQGTAAAWSELRSQQHPDQPSIRYAQVTGKIHNTILELEKRYELILIDAGGYDSVELRSSLFVTDLHLLPLPPSAYALWALDDLEPLREQASLTNSRLQTMAVLNRAQRHYRVHDAEQAREHLEGQGLRLAQTVLYDRRAFRRSEDEGLTVAELRPQDPTATAELQGLFQEICDEVSK